MSTGGFSFTGFGNTGKTATTTPAFGTSTTPTFGSSTNSGFGSSTNSTFGSSQTTSPFGSGWNNQAKPGMAGMGQQQAAPNPISSLLQSYKYMF